MTTARFHAYVLGGEDATLIGEGTREEVDESALCWLEENEVPTGRTLVVARVVQEYAAEEIQVARMALDLKRAEAR